MQIVCTGLVVLQVESCQLELWDMLRPEESEAMELLAGLWVLSKVGNALSNSPFSRLPEHVDLSTLNFPLLSELKEVYKKDGMGLGI